MWNIRLSASLANANRNRGHTAHLITIRLLQLLSKYRSCERQHLEQQMTLFARSMVVMTDPRGSSRSSNPRDIPKRASDAVEGEVPQPTHPPPITRPRKLYKKERASQRLGGRRVAPPLHDPELGDPSNASKPNSTALQSTAVKSAKPPGISKSGARRRTVQREPGRDRRTEHRSGNGLMALSNPCQIMHRFVRMTATTGPMYCGLHSPVTRIRQARTDTERTNSRSSSQKAEVTACQHHL